MKNINKYIITLLQIRGVGRKIAGNIIDRSNLKINNINDLYSFFIEEKNKNKRIVDTDLDTFTEYYKKSLEVIDEIEKYNIKIINKYDEKYPYKYKNIDNPPLILFAKGNTELLNYENIISITGTRTPTGIAQDKCKDVVRNFVKNNFVIVSGLAVGCDTIAHNTCLENNGLTIAVIPSSLDNIYPKVNMDLANNIIKQGGLLLSEYLINVEKKINKNQFIERDRLISGISNALCVIETKIKGGSMQTFEYAKKQNKLIGVLGFNKENEYNKGNGFLINNEKILAIKDSDDIVSFMEKVKKNEYIKEDEASHQTSLFS